MIVGITVETMVASIEASTITIIMAAVTYRRSMGRVSPEAAEPTTDVDAVGTKGPETEAGRMSASVTTIHFQVENPEAGKTYLSPTALAVALEVSLRLSPPEHVPRK
jgi:hypothetical protein